MVTSPGPFGSPAIERLMISTVAKPNAPAAQMEGGVLTVDYGGYPVSSVPAFISSVWPSPVGAAAPGNGLGVNSTTYYSSGAIDPVLPQVLSDLAPNVFANTTSSNGGPNGLAWVAGNQTFGDFSDPLFGPVPGRLVIAEHSVPGAVPQVVGVNLQSPFSPYADKLLVWTRTEPLAGLLPQYILVPCRDGVEIYDPAPPGAPPVAPALVKVVPVPAGKEICSNVSYFGPSSLDGLGGANPYFIVLMRDRRVGTAPTDPGETQGANGGINFLVFDLLPSSVPASFPTPPPGASDPTSGLGAFLPVVTPLDMVRGFNDIAIAPPERNATGGWKSDPRPNATAWFGVWGANASLAGQPVFGAMVGVENHGLNPYWDGQAGFNAAFTGTGPNVRYFTPVDDQGNVYEPFPAPVGEVSTNPIFNGSTAGDLVNQNLVTWYFDNGEDYGVATLDVLATWRPLSNQAVPGGILVDGTAGGTYPNAPARSHETITERPLFGYMNYPIFATVFAQRQCGIETFAGWVMPSLPPLNRPRYHLSRFGVPGVQAPQTPPPQDVPWNYQKRMHSVFQPAFIDHAVAGSSPYTQSNDICVTIQATEPLGVPVPQPWPREDDPVTYFVNWRWDPVVQISPWPQGVNYLDWHSALANNTLNNRLFPWFGRDPSVPSHFATTCPPPNSLPNNMINFGGAHYFPGQTPLWVDWSNFGGTAGGSAFNINLEHRSVLRSHANLFPLTGNDAWVGLGADMRLKFSLAANGQQHTNLLLGAPQQRSVILAHVQQTESGASSAGLPPTAGGPAGYR
ncbi:MAG TPA: hypothetical protein PKA37_09000, partial [Planctomycetota bacterium]|nr:hypothetical protein [Planctomycetota bacterium]